MCSPWVRGGVCGEAARSLLRRQFSQENYAAPPSDAEPYPVAEIFQSNTNFFTGLTESTMLAARVVITISGTIYIAL